LAEGELMRWQFWRKKRQFSDERIRDIVLIAMNNHPKNCIFAPNAVEKIIAAGIKTIRVSEDEKILEDALVVAFEENEIYCPHEGIDRRKEFGII
jgi:hypothetical protein